MTHKLVLLGEIAERSYSLQGKASGAHHEPGTGRPADEVLAQWEHREVQRLRDVGMATWRDELADATADVYAAAEWPAQRAALLNAAAVLLCWLLDGDATCPAGVLEVLPADAPTGGSTSFGPVTLDRDASVLRVRVDDTLTGRIRDAILARAKRDDASLDVDSDWYRQVAFRDAQAVVDLLRAEAEAAR